MNRRSRTKVIIEAFVSEGNLDKDEEIIARTRFAGWTRERQKIILGIDSKTLDDIIKTIINKYDLVQKSSILLPPRKQSAVETFMDNCHKNAVWDDDELSTTNMKYLIDEWIFDERNRKIMKLKLIDNWTYERIAEEVGMSDKQIKNIVASSKEILQKHTKYNIP